MLDKDKIKKAKHIFVLVHGKPCPSSVKITRKEAIFLLEHHEGDYLVDLIQKKAWAEVFISPNT